MRYKSSSFVHSAVIIVENLTCEVASFSGSASSSLALSVGTVCGTRCLKCRPVLVVFHTHVFIKFLLRFPRFTGSPIVEQVLGFLCSYDSEDTVL